MEERQTNYTIAEGYELPSKGLIYDTPVNAHVELRSMTARDEMKRLSPTTAPLKTLANIIEGCMLEKPSIHVYDMCLGDYEYLLHKLRVVTYGPEYPVVVACPYCGTTIEKEMSLDELEVKEYDADTINSLKNITLPVSNKVITLKFQTPRMLDEATDKVKDFKRRYKEADLDFEVFVKIITSIEFVDGRHLLQPELETFINTLPAKDMQKILNSIDKLNAAIGLESTFSMPCPNCGHDVKSFFRFGPEFFRPSNI